MNTNTILALVAVAAIAYAVGRRAAAVAAAAPDADPYAQLGSTNWVSAWRGDA